MNQPLISVIIPCYNYGKFLADAVNSVCSQTYTHWECLIVDDGSKDDTQEKGQDLAAMDKRVFYHYKENGGLSSARNFGISLAKGELICFLDADDLLDENKLDEQLKCFLKNPEADIVYGKAMFFEKNDLAQLYSGKDKASTEELPRFSGSGNALLGLLVEQNITVVSAPLIRRTVFDRAGNFDTSYKSYEDWHFWLRCALVGCRFLYCDKPEVCTYIRFGHESMMSDKKKLVRAGIQLRRFLAPKLPMKFRFYNFYRLLRSRLKLVTLK